MVHQFTDAIRQRVPKVARAALYVTGILTPVVAGLEKIWDVIPADVEPKLVATALVWGGLLNALSLTQTRD